MANQLENPSACLDLSLLAQLGALLQGSGGSLSEIRTWDDKPPLFSSS